MPDLFDEEISLYINYPFCVDKCPFCPIKTIKYEPDCVSAYISSLKKEIDIWIQGMGGHNIKVNCIHFGGGTPSLMKENELDDILKTVDKIIDIDSAEIVFEAHPKFVTKELLKYFAGLRNCTMNFGVQSFDNSLLFAMRRHYQDIDILHILETAKQMFDIIGVDYICDWPTSDFRTLEKDLKYIEIIRPEHISQYPLNIQQDCGLKQCMGSLGEVGRKVLLNTICEHYLMDMGYNRYSLFHYENKKISHRYGRHQLVGGKWIGFGAKAYTYLGNVIRVNSPVGEYVKGNFLSQEIFLDEMQHLLWEIMFFIRNIPFPREVIQKKYGYIISALYGNMEKKLQKKGYISPHQDRKLTWNGVIHLDEVEQIITEAFVSGQVL